MTHRNFRELFGAREELGCSVCVGLDSEAGKIPEGVDRVAFNQAIVGATWDLVCAYKPNKAFYDAQGTRGLGELAETITGINCVAPGVPVILDAKYGDIGNTNAGYVASTFDFLGADAVTVHPYLGMDSLAPFLARDDKGIFVLCRTSNPGSGEFQDRLVHPTPEEAEGWGIPRDAIPFYELVAYRVANEWNKQGNCGLVVGATFPDELRRVRAIVGDSMPILIPGVGAQGGDVKATVLAGRNNCGGGMIINSSRGIIFASKGPDFPAAARREAEKLHELVNQYRMIGIS